MCELVAPNPPLICSALREVGGTLMNDAGQLLAKLVVDDGTFERFPLVPLVAASPLLAEAARDVVADPVVVHITGFSLDTVQVLLGLMMSGTVTESEEQILAVMQLCDLLGISRTMGKNFRLTLLESNVAVNVTEEPTEQVVKHNDVQQGEELKFCEEIETKLDGSNCMVGKRRKKQNSVLGNAVLAEERHSSDTVRSSTSKCEPTTQHSESTKSEEGVVSKRRRKQHYSRASLMCHQQHVKRTFACQKCKAVFETNRQLLEHELFHSNLTMYKCGNCARTFKRIGNLQQHAVVCGVLPLFQCNLCPQSFSKGIILQHHIIARHEPLKERIYRCHVCNKILSTGDALKYHMNVHLGKKPFRCSCGKQFRSKNAQHNHEKHCYCAK